MDSQTLFNVAIGLSSLLGGFVLKSVYDAIQDLRHSDGELHDRINKLPETYMRRDDFNTFGHDIKESLRRIETKLDGKADK